MTLWAAVAGWVLVIWLALRAARLAHRLNLVAEADHELRGPVSALSLAVEALERRRDPLRHREVDRVARLGPVERDQQDAAGGLGEDRLAHAANRVRAGMRSPRSSARSTSTQRSPRDSASTRACGLTDWAARTPWHRPMAGSSRMRAR